MSEIIRILFFVIHSINEPSKPTKQGVLAVLAVP